MSTSSVSSAPITITGLASGLDTNSIITELGTAETDAVTQQQNNQTALQSQLTEWQTVNTNLANLQTQALGLSVQSAFDGTSATSSATSVATVTAGTGAAAGSHSLSVTTLAQAQQVLSGGQTDATTALNLTGSFSLNGHTITVASSNDLSDVANAINSANAGVNASVLTISPGDVKLSLTSTNSGTANSISATDISGGTVLQSLGLMASDTDTAIRDSVTTASGATGAASVAFTSSGATIGSLMTTTNVAAPSGTVQINGTSVSLNLATMSLNQVASAINAAGITGVTAQIVAVPNANGVVNANSTQQLQLVSTTGAITASSFTDSNGVLSSLGITQAAYTTQVTPPQDATFSVDNINFTRSTNTVSDVIPNVTLNLLSAGSGATSTINVTQDTADPISAIQGFVTAYNTMNDYVNTANTFTPPATGASSGTAGSSPPLFGNYTLISMQNQLALSLGTSVDGQTLDSIGVTLSTSGDLTVNTATLTSALQTNPTAVYQLFGVSGTATNSAVTFNSATIATQDSSATGYPVVVTTPATQATTTAGTVQTTASTAAETLTFGGTLFEGSDFNLTIPSGSTQADIIALINGNSNLNQNLIASTDPTTGALSILSKGYGQANSFTVQSDTAASTSDSGIGTDVMTGTGVDIAGTIDGEAATGIGQTLTGNTGDQNVDGLSLNITATTAGSYGAVNITHGLADQLNSLVTSFTTGTDSDIGSAEASVNQQITDIGNQITEMQTELSNYTALLTSEFAAMETQVSTLKSAGDALNAELGTTTSSSSSSSSGSSSGSSSSSSA